jgi:hypothetical protein
MIVTFTRTGERRYSVSVEGPNISPAKMDPAPGYDSRLPHDVAHFIVENELGIEGGIFGQMAIGGILRPVEQNSRVQRKAKKKRVAIFKANESDALFSEHAVWAAQSRWEKQAIVPETKIAPTDIERICESFEAFATEWSALPVGGSIALEWKHSVNATKRRR